MNDPNDSDTGKVMGKTPACSTPCDPDCDAVCHESHVAGHKKQHWPYDCPAADDYVWGGNDFTGTAIKRLRAERDDARRQLAAWMAGLRPLRTEWSTENDHLDPDDSIVDRKLAEKRVSTYPQIHTNVLTRQLYAGSWLRAGGMVSFDIASVSDGINCITLPSRADVQAGRTVEIKMRSPGDAKADTEPGSSFWADLSRRLRDEPEFRKGYIETSQQIQALDDAANGDGPFRDGLRDQLVATGMAAAEQWLATRANRRMSDVNKKRLIGHIVNALWGQIEQAAIGMAEHIAENRESRTDEAAESPWCPDCIHDPSAHRRTTGCIRCTCNYGRGNEERDDG